MAKSGQKSEIGSSALKKIRKICFVDPKVARAAYWLWEGSMNLANFLKGKGDKLLRMVRALAERWMVKRHTVREKFGAQGKF